MKFKLTFILLLSSFLLLAITNPQSTEHQKAVKDALYQKENIQAESFVENNKILNNKNIEQTIDNYFVGYDIKELTQKSVERVNFGLFSITRFNNKGCISAIGIGALGNVILWDDLTSVKLRAEVNK